MNNKKHVVLKDIFYSYPRGDFSIKDVSLSFNKAEITAIVGPNGSGKTTLGKIIVGIFKPNSGCVMLSGQDTSKWELHDFGNQVGYLFQNPSRQIFAQTVYEELTFAQELLGKDKKETKAKCEALLEEFNLTHLKDMTPLKLSRGEKQRLVIAAILMSDPGFILLDEPSTALDVKRKDTLYKTLTRLEDKGIGVLVITHDDGFVKEYAKRVVTMEKGRVIADERV